MRLINADVLYKEIYHQERRLEKCYVDHLGIITEQPSVDAVPVVRCGKCKWWSEELWACTARGHGLASSDPDFYCADGERKGGNE